MELDERVKNMELQERVMHRETELGAVMKNLDSDKLNNDTKMSDIDFNARLKDIEIDACLVFDELVRMGILPSTAGLTRQKKRLSVSKDGLGRQEKVEIVKGDREQKSSGSFASRLGALFQKRE
jgi:hypothetical protein